MGHGGFVLTAPAGHAVIAQVDARRDDEPVIGQGLPAGEHHHLTVPVNAGGHVMGHGDAVGRCHLLVGMADVGHLLVAADHQIGVEAGYELPARLNQRQVECAGAVLGDVARGGAATCATADDHNAGLGLAYHRRAADGEHAGTRPQSSQQGAAIE